MSASVMTYTYSPEEYIIRTHTLIGTGWLLPRNRYSALQLTDRRAHYPVATTSRANSSIKILGRLKTADAERGEQLVPIRLEFDVEHHRYRDTFIWNLNGEHALHGRHYAW